MTPAEAQQGGGRGGRGGGTGAGGGRGGGPQEGAPQVRVSPDGKKEAVIWNYNLTVRDAGTQKNTFEVR